MLFSGGTVLLNNTMYLCLLSTSVYHSLFQFILVITILQTLLNLNLCCSVYNYRFTKQVVLLW